jgi:hypothetical protein
VRERCSNQRDRLHRLSRFTYRLTDSIGQATRFSYTNAHASIVIADHGDNAESETAATLNDLRHPCDMDYALVQFFPFFQIPFSPHRTFSFLSSG